MFIFVLGEFKYTWRITLCAYEMRARPAALAAAADKNVVKINVRVLLICSG